MSNRDKQLKLPEIVLFGDSLTQWSFDAETRGFGWVLQRKYEGKAEVVNEGVAGYTSTWLEPDFRRIIECSTKPCAPPTLLFTVFLGANDACLPPSGAHVPLPKFEENIRAYVEEILVQDKLNDTKIVLITPPPINIPDPSPEDVNKREDPDLGPRFAAAPASHDPKEEKGYRTYISKKRYAEKIMEIAKSYEDTNRVIGLNFWKALIDAALEEQHRLGDEDAYDEDRLPGCGLKWAKAFKPGYFTDGLHLNGKAYEILSRELLDAVRKKWPQLAPENIGM